MVQVFAKQELLRLGLSDPVIRAALRCCLQRIRRGWFALIRPCEVLEHAALHTSIGTQPLAYPNRFGDIRDRSEALKLLIRSRHSDLQPTDCFSHISAALIHGIQPPYPATDRTEIIRPGYHAAFRDLRIYDRSLMPSDRTQVGDLAVTALNRTLLDIAHDYPLEISVPMVSEAMKVRSVEKTDLLNHVSPGRRGCKNARQAIELADARHESQGESLCAVKFHRFSINGMIPQVNIYDSEGRFIARSDFRLEGLPLIVEFHGLGKYYLNEDGPDQASKNNHARHMRLTNAGFTVFNLVWGDLFRSEMFVAIKKFIVESTPQLRKQAP